MTAAIEIDRKTGLKAFNTRAKANKRIAGKGYSKIEERSLKILPEQSTGAIFDADEQAKYRAFKESRAGAADYIAMEGEFAHYLDDVYSSAPVERETLTDSCEVLVIGAGFAGLLLWYKLQEAGFHDVRFCEKGGDVGGTWYWNRYPGVACDVESYSYLPLLDEMRYFPTMKFASGFEILEYCQMMAERTGFYKRCLFHTTVQTTEWDQDTSSWIVSTDRGDRMKARFVVLANGILSTPKLARIDGMEQFAGKSFHTSRWDYNVDLRGKTVGIIGTGATSVQTVPELAKIVKQLYVFQRTPSIVDVRDQRETRPDEIEKWSNEPGWAKARRERYARLSVGRSALKAHDDFLSGKVPDPELDKLSFQGSLEEQLNNNFKIMEQIRARIDMVVKDPKTAAALKPYYPWGCKRPTFHDEYLPSFNLPHVTLVDTAPAGVSRISTKGVVHNDVEYPLDVLIYATGFRWMATSTFNMIVGRNGQTLHDKWKTGGTRTYLGIHSNGFPNLLIVSGPQGGGGQFNFTRVIDSHADYITWMLRTMRARNIRSVDVKKEAEDAYAAHCREADIRTSAFRSGCQSYYNGDGNAEPGSLAYYGGAEKWHQIRTDAQESLEPYMFEQTHQSST